MPQQTEPNANNALGDLLLIWAAKVPGIDPTTHFWFERGGVQYRICDGVRWIEGTGTDNRPNFSVPCSLCKETYLEDVLRGAKLLHLLPEPPALDNNVGTPDNRVSLSNLRVYPIVSGRVPHETQGLEAVVMPKVPVKMFAGFYEGRPAKQVSIVRTIRTRLINPEMYMAHNYYGALRNAIRDTHWATRNIETLQDALDPLIGNIRPDKQQNYRTAIESYIRFWRDRGASYFPVKAVDVEMAGLTIAVTPELGMQTGDDFQVLKIWFDAKGPTQPARQVIHYFVDRAREQSNEWEDYWHSGILDVRRRNIPLPPRNAKDFELGLYGQIAAFSQIWNELEQQALNYGE